MGADREGEEEVEEEVVGMTFFQLCGPDVGESGSGSGRICPRGCGDSIGRGG